MERAGVEITAALDLSKAIKQRAVEGDGVGTDIPMMLHLFNNGRPLGAAVLVGERELTLGAIIVFIGLSAANQAVLVTDAFSFHGQEPPPGDGNLAQAFAAGNPNVVECLNAASVRADGTTAVLEAPYSYEGRSVAWAEPADFLDEFGGEVDGELEGDYADAMRYAFETQQFREDPADLVEIAKFLDCDIMIPTTADARCPCGSGQKGQDCCLTT